MSIKGIIKKKHCNTTRLYTTGIVGNYDRKGNKKEQP
jgi:hypothetical protein